MDQNEAKQFKKCARCHSEILLAYFSTNRKGEIKKCCDPCLRRFKCDRCDYACRTNSDLKKHIKQVHDKIKDVKCGQCDYKCSTKGNLKIHVKMVHDKIKDFTCGQCDFKCSTKGHLKRHVKMVHDKIKDFTCGQCDFKCSTKGHLKRHIKMVHDKIKDFTCDQCDYKCSIKDTLKQHIKQVHDKIKDVKCGQCDYACSTKGTLKQHIKQVHDKIKDVKCGQCDYACSTNSTLKRHITRCTGKFNCSSGEFDVMKTLTVLGLEKYKDYMYDETYEARDKYLLRWDFIITLDNGNMVMIEYDGGFHYAPIRMGNMTDEEAQTAFENNQRRDKIKNDYCKKNNIPLLRIPYWEKENIHTLVSDFIKEALN